MSDSPAYVTILNHYHQLVNRCDPKIIVTTHSYSPAVFTATCTFVDHNSISRDVIAQASTKADAKSKMALQALQLLFGRVPRIDELPKLVKLNTVRRQLDSQNFDQIPNDLEFEMMIEYCDDRLDPEQRKLGKGYLALLQQHKKALKSLADIQERQMKEEIAKVHAIYLPKWPEWAANKADTFKAIMKMYKKLKPQYTFAAVNIYKERVTKPRMLAGHATSNYELKYKWDDQKSLLQLWEDEDVLSFQFLEKKYEGANLHTILSSIINDVVVSEMLRGMSV